MNTEGNPDTETDTDTDEILPLLAPVRLFLLLQVSVGIFKQSKRARNRVGLGLSYRPRQATQPGDIGALESILGLLKSLKIRALIVYVRIARVR
jgi:hypothetical protein